MRTTEQINYFSPSPFINFLNEFEILEKIEFSLETVECLWTGLARRLWSLRYARYLHVDNVGVDNDSLRVDYVDYVN